MKRNLSRKQFLSLSAFGGLGLLVTRCTLDDTTTGTGGMAGTGTSGPTGSSTSSSSTSSMSSTATTGSGGSGGSSTSSSASGGKGGGGGSGGKGGAGGSAGSGGRGGSGGAGGSKDGGADGGGMCTNMLTASISMNHVGMEHMLVIPAADVTAGMPKTYATSGALQNHMHYVALTAADFMTLAMGGTVTKHSCNGGDHQYTIKCGTPPTAGTQTCTATDNCGMAMTGAPTAGGPCM